MDVQNVSSSGHRDVSSEQINEWLKFRDSEVNFQDSVYSKMEGTMYIPMSPDSRMQVVENPALELQSWLDSIRDSQ